MDRDRRAPPVVAIGLGVLLLAGGAFAWTAGGRPSTASAFGPPNDGGTGPTVVQLSPDSRVHPDGEAVRAQLQAHYTAINERDYASWQATVVTQRSAALPEPAWRDAYRSTRDGTVRVDRIDDVPSGGLLVRVRFVSTQALADAPPGVRAERICWRSTLPMEGAPPRIGMTRGGSSVPEAC